jgi:toxin FitB
MLLDSNIIIYASKPGYDDLREWLRNHSIIVSALSQLEVLGYHRLTDEERNFFVAFFSIMPILMIMQEVLNQAIELRQQRKMSLGDSIIAATALVHDLPIVTHNSADFQWITNLVVIDPINKV